MFTAHRRIALAGAGIAAIATSLLLTAAGATAAPAASAASTTTDPVQAAAGWLSTQFVDDSHLPAPAGDHFDSKFGSSYFPNYGENADVVFGLAAAKSSAAKVTTALTYLADNIDNYADVSGAQGGPFDGSLGKSAVAAIVAGQDPTAFGGVDLLKQLKTDECAAASASCAAAGAALNIFASASESFVLIAEARAGGADAPSSAAVNYFLSLQCDSGGFTTNTAACGSGPADIDATSYAIMALQAVGGHPDQVAKAVSWLQSQETAGKYWVVQNVPNANSTGLAAAALGGQGVDVSGPRAWLLSQQVPAGKPGAGAVEYGGTFQPTTTSAASLSVLATAQALPGLVDGGSLATLDAAGSTSGPSMFAPTVKLSSATVSPGGKQTASGTGFAAGEKVTATIHSTPAVVGSANAAADGSVTLSFTVPSALPAGDHTLILTGSSSDLSATEHITVRAAASASTGGSGTGGTTGPGSTTTTTGSTGFGTEPLAATGLDGRRLTVLASLGVLSVVAGAALQFVGRRRTR